MRFSSEQQIKDLYSRFSNLVIGISEYSVGERSHLVSNWVIEGTKIMSADRTHVSQLVIAENASIRDAMQAIDSNGREMVLVRDKSDRIVGLISDGDVRRGLLAGQSLWTWPPPKS